LATRTVVRIVSANYLQEERGTKSTGDISEKAAGRTLAASRPLRISGRNPKPPFERWSGYIWGSVEWSCHIEGSVEWLDGWIAHKSKSIELHV
jgi:hypothetical protein